MSTVLGKFLYDGSDHVTWPSPWSPAVDHDQSVFLDRFFKGCVSNINRLDQHKFLFFGDISSRNPPTRELHFCSMNTSSLRGQDLQTVLRETVSRGFSEVFGDLEDIQYVYHAILVQIYLWVIGGVSGFAVESVRHYEYV